MSTQTAAIFFSVLLAISSTLPAQSLDTAPGVKPETSATPAAPSTPAPVVTLPPGTSLLNWQPEPGTPFIELVSKQPGQQVEIERLVDIPPGVKALQFSVKYRVANLKKGMDENYDARAILEFMDASLKPVAAAPPMVFSSGTTGWTTATEHFAVPKAAAKLLITPCLFHAGSGTLDIAEIHLVTVGDPEADTLVSEAAGAAEEKAADQAAIIKQEISQPSKSAGLKVSGNRLVTPDGKTVWLQGVNVCGLEWLVGGSNPVWSIHVAIDDWKANVIRLPVSDSFWFGHGRGKITSNDPGAYRAIVDEAIRMAASKGAYVVLDLHRYLAPDDKCVEFWKDAAERYKNNPAVLFDILNEPHDTTWEVWRNGGTFTTKGRDARAIQSVGMQALVNAVRGTGAKNIIVAGGLGYAFDLTGILNGYALDDKGGNGIMYATHFYNWHKGWEKHFMAVAEKYPVLVGECGADTHKMNFIPANQQEDPYTWAPDAIGFIQKNHLNWTAWCFHTRANPDLLLDWDYYTPTPFWGVFVKDALAGKQYEMKRER